MPKPLMIVQILKQLSFKQLALGSLLLTVSQLGLSLESSPNNSQAIDTVTSQLTSYPSYVYLDARLEAVNQSTISAQTSGIVESIHVDINDNVKAGQTLVIINDTQQQAQISQAFANLAQSEAQNEDAQILLKRNRSLLNKKTLSQGEFDSSLARAKSTQAAVLAAKSMLKQAKEQLSYTHIKAPYSGIVSARMIQVGELVNPGKPLMTGFAPHPLRAVTDIPEHIANKLSVLAAPQADIKIHAQGHIITAASYTLFPYADSRYSSVRARIDLPNTSADSTINSHALLIPGSWVNVAVPTGVKNGIYLPKTAIHQQGEVSSIYVQDKKSQSFKLRYVRLGKTLDNNTIEIIAGLSANEKVAVDVLAAIQQLVSAQKKKTEL